MKKIILMSVGELMLKGQNRHLFEKKLVKNIKNSIKEMGSIHIECNQGRIYIRPESEDYRFSKAVLYLKKISGIANISIAIETEKDINTIKESINKYLEDALNNKQYKTFKVITKRADKLFSMSSPELAKELGGFILTEFSFLKVDVHNPELKLYVEIRDKTYIYHNREKGSCGLPVGTNGKGMLLLSGGIDSPVAGWMMSKRGLEIEAIHFFSYPYTGLKSKEKVIDLARILARFTHSVKLHIIPFTDIQLYINENCPEEYSVIIMRRIMIILANRLARKTGSKALITGECLGQVASQTIEALSVTDTVSELPVFRPLIGMDKLEIIQIAKDIESYETSILPYEDCCTVFVPKHPKTKPSLKSVLEIEEKMDVEEMIEKAIKEREKILI